MKRYIQLFKKFIIIIAALAVFGIGLLTILPEAVLWNFLPGVTSTEETREFCSSMLAVTENIDRSTKESNPNAYNMAIGITLTGITAKTADTADAGTESDLILLQYTTAIVKCRLLMQQKDLSFIQYYLIKLPYQSGNTTLMKLSLPLAQNAARLPEGFMTKEHLEAQ